MCQTQDLDEDEQLARALAASMEDAAPPAYEPSTSAASRSNGNQPQNLGQSNGHSRNVAQQKQQKPAGNLTFEKSHPSFQTSSVDLKPKYNVLLYASKSAFQIEKSRVSLLQMPLPQ